MILRSLLLAVPAGMVLASTPALSDPRIATHFYQPSEVVTVRGATAIQSTIAFAPDEQIQNVAVGDSATWQVTPNKRADLLFVKPMNPRARTNMTVVTDQRTYLFDLVCSPRAASVYMLRFTYPAPIARPAAVPIAAAPVAVTPPPPAPPDPTALNFAWESHGDKLLIPSRSFDDGQSTYLAWPKDVALPAILLREANGTEGPVNYTTRGDFIVVEGVPAQLILRSGKQVATLTSVPHPQAASKAAASDQSAMNQERPSRPFAHIADGRP